MTEDDYVTVKIVSPEEVPGQHHQDLTDIAEMLGGAPFLLSVFLQQMFTEGKEGEEDTENWAIILVVNSFTSAMETLNLMSRVATDLVMPEFKTPEERALQGDDGDNAPLFFKDTPVQVVMFSILPGQPESVATVASPPPIDGWKADSIWAGLDVESQQQFLQEGLEISMFPDRFRFTDPGKGPGGFNA